MVNRTSFLVVDDSGTTRRLVKQSLNLLFSSAEILLAADGKEALRILKESRVDLVLSDWNMPQMDGGELLYEIRRDPALKELPFILMTGNTDRDFIITAIQLGANQYIVKPFSPAELEKKIRSALNSLSKRREQRYSLADHVAVVRLGGRAFGGRVLDLSRTGALISVEYDGSMRLFGSCELDLQLPDPNGLEANTTLIGALVGTIVRLEAENTFHPTSRKSLMALYFHPGTMERDVERKLNGVIKWLASKAPDVIADS